MKIKNGFYRVYQAVSSIFQKLLPWRQSELIIGEEPYRKLAIQIVHDEIGKIFIITTNGFVKRKTLDELLMELDREGIAYSIFDGVMPNPTVTDVESALEQYKAHGSEGLIAFGGGSVMDLAKAVGARVARPNKSVNQMAGLLKVRKKIPKLYAIPTTAGTGSETTVAAVIVDDKTRHKYAINDLSLIPSYAILSPEITVGLSPNLTATTGMDALTHAVESYTNLFAPKVARENAKRAVKLIFENLERAYDDGTDIEARKNMLEASYYAGAAFTRAYVGNVHAVAHTLGGMYDVAHGFANAVLLPIVLREYGDAVDKSLSELAELVGIGGNSEKESAEHFISAIESMNAKMNIPKKFENTIRDEDIPQLIDWAISEANPLYPVPVIWNRAQYEKIYNMVK